MPEIARGELWAKRSNSYFSAHPTLKSIVAALGAVVAIAVTIACLKGVMGALGDLGHTGLGGGAVSIGDSPLVAIIILVIVSIAVWHSPFRILTWIVGYAGMLSAFFFSILKFGGWGLLVFAVVAYTLIGIFERIFERKIPDPDAEQATPR